MTALEMQRTLVKSPPELWDELSDVVGLARLLDRGFGEIRIVRTTPWRRVEWEAGSTRGTIELEPSGWGTRVRLAADVAAGAAQAQATLARALDALGAAHHRPFSRS
ncbi:MAG: hypothetical protein ABSC56_11960 [Solirubrobacteraceae bacterium]